MLRSALCRPSWDRRPPYRRCSSPQWQQQQQRVWRHLARLPVEGVAVVVVCCHFMCNCNNLQRPIRAICTRTTLITILLRAPGIDAAGRGRGRGGDQAGTNPAYRPASAAGAGNPLLPPTAFMSLLVDLCLSLRRECSTLLCRQGCRCPIRLYSLSTSRTQLKLSLKGCVTISAWPLLLS